MQNLYRTQHDTPLSLNDKWSSPFLSSNSNQTLHLQLKFVSHISLWIFNHGYLQSLRDVTNQSLDRTISKRLSDGTIKEYKFKPRLRKTLQFTFQSEAGKLCFEDKIRRASELYNDKNASKKSSNTDFFDTLLDKYLEASTQSPEVNASCNDIPSAELCEPMFVTEVQQVLQLTRHIQEHGKICSSQLVLKEDKRHGHVGLLTFACCKGYNIKFESSSKEGQYFTANLRLMLGELCSGMLHVQFNKLCNFPKLGNI